MLHASVLEQRSENFDAFLHWPIVIAKVFVYWKFRGKFSDFSPEHCVECESMYVSIIFGSTVSYDFEKLRTKDPDRII